MAYPARVRTQGLLRLVLFVLLLLAPAACSDAERAPAVTETAAAPAARETRPEPAKPPPKPRGRPLPAFQGTDLDGKPIALSDIVGRRFLLFGFNPEVADARTLGPALAAILLARSEQNFEVVGMAVGTGNETARAFLAEQALDVPVFYDPSGSFQSKLGLRTPVWALVVDADGNLIQGTESFPRDGPDPAGATLAMLQEFLRIPVETPGEAIFGQLPEAPLFTAERLEGGEPFRLASTRGRPLVLIFFLHTCPHCHHALAFFREALDEIPEDVRPGIVGISIVGQSPAVRARLKEDELDFFPVLVDTDHAIRTQYGASAGVPVILLLDSEGRIVERIDGWRDDRDAALMRMQLARVSGQRVPMLLHKTGYSGNDFCGVCHAEEAATWELTNHATAYDTLVRHGADHDGECVSCHVVGYDEPGGFSLARPEPALENVGCETCHGRGGPHLTPDPPAGHDYASACASCHTPEHSVGFEFASFLPQISHAANSAFAGLSAEEKRELLEKRRGHRDVLPKGADYVGSEACQSCHAAEHATWSAQPHARAFETLTAQGEAEAECLTCHTTGWGRGGFPKDGAPADHAALLGVGCESCHGPGGDHVGADAPKRGTILALGDKCDSCVILQICGGCHDDANDPGFEFEVQEKIDLQRHGTIEAGTGKPKSATGASLPAAAVVGLLEQGFAAEPRR
jgi:peroxiredoxin/nitrate/TMAO reductase-like tetraheme cytochrome c subunit